MNRPLYIIILGLAVLGSSGFTRSQVSTQYVCAPCNCESDGKTFDKPGKCPSCGMQLVVKDAVPAYQLNDPTEDRDYASTYRRKLTKLAEGIYEIRHPEAPDNFPQSNTTVIIGSKAVLVVDTCYLPSAAKEDIAQIKTWTDKPVKYVLNTHWHYDHTMGNQAYADAFPGVTFVAQIKTREAMAGYNPQWFAKYPVRTQGFKDQLATGKDAQGEPLNDSFKATLPDTIKGREQVQAEFKDLKVPLASVTFEKEYKIDLGGRQARLLCLGRGNTAGDAIVFLPKERIVVTGDLMDHPIPYLGGGFPTEEVQTLKAMAALPADTYVPGHGEVVHGKTFIHQEIEFISEILRLVSDEVYKVGNGSNNLEVVSAGVKARLNLPKWQEIFAGDDPDNIDFFTNFSLEGVIRAAYVETYRR